MDKKNNIYQVLLANPKMDWTVKSLAKHLGVTETYLQFHLDCLFREGKVLQDGNEVVAV